MKPKKVLKQIIHDIEDMHPDDIEEMSNGELVIYTGIFRWTDGSYHHHEEPNPLSVESDANQPYGCDDPDRHRESCIANNNHVINKSDGLCKNCGH